MERPKELSERQILAAQSLAAGYTFRDAAKRAKCSPEGIRQWKMLEAFNDAIWDYQQEIFHRSFGVASEALPDALRKLREMIDSQDPDIAPNVKLQAIKILLDSAHKQYEARTIERRLETLEANAERQALHQSETSGAITGSTE